MLRACNGYDAEFRVSALGWGSMPQSSRFEVSLVGVYAL